MGFVPSLLAILLAVGGTPVAVILGAFLGWRFTDGQKPVVRGLASWLSGAVFAYTFGMLWFVPPVIAEGNQEPTTTVDVVPGGPAEGAGLKSGDRVVAANGRAVKAWEDIPAFTRANPKTEPDELEIERNGKRLTFRATPINDSLGIRTRPKGGPFPAARASGYVLAAPFYTVRSTLGAFTPGERDLSGPVGVRTVSRWRWTMPFWMGGAWTSLLGALLVLGHLLTLPLVTVALVKRAARRAA
jgi:hypothetical protein